MARGSDHDDSKKPASRKGKSGKSFHPRISTNFDPATPEFKPSGNESSRWTPYPTLPTSTGTYTNPLRQIQDTVARLERDVASQGENATQELERARSEFKSARQDLVTKDEMGKMKLSMTFDSLSAAEQGLLNKESLAFLQNAMRNDINTMYSMIQNLQGQHKALEGENKKLLAAVGGKGQGELEAPAGWKMIEAAPEKQEIAVAEKEPAKEKREDKPVSVKGEQANTQAPGFEEQHAAKPETVQEENKLAVVKLKKSAGHEKKTIHPSDKLLNRLQRAAAAMVTQSEPAARDTSNTSTVVTRNRPSPDVTSQPSLLSSSSWQPIAIRLLGSSGITAPSSHEETFTLRFLHEHLGSTQLSPGLYISHLDSVLGSATFWVLSAPYDPFAPITPGAHGAKMTPFFNDHVDADAYDNTPVFVSMDEREGYKYMGTYMQPRYSDQLSHSEMADHVPKRIKDFWTENLANAKYGPEWLTKALMEHLVPRPVYRGPVRRQEGEPKCKDLEISEQLTLYGGELLEWEAEARVVVESLSQSDVAAMWEKADVDEPKGLRLWGEYLQCVGYDGEFYDRLVSLEAGLELTEAQLEAQTAQLKIDAQKLVVKKAEPVGKKAGIENLGVEKTAVKEAVEADEAEVEKMQAEKDLKLERKPEEKKAERFTYDSTFVPRKKKN